MFDNKTIRWILGILAVGIVVYVGILLMDENGHLISHLLPPKQTYVTAEVDTAIVRRDLRRKGDVEKEPADSVPARVSVTRMVTDSDSVGTVDLYRPQQAAVNIDLEEHTEPVYLTWEDFKSWFHFLQVTYESIRDKFQEE